MVRAKSISRMGNIEIVDYPTRDTIFWTHVGEGKIHKATVYFSSMFPGSNRVNPYFMADGRRQHLYKFKDIQ